MEKRWQDKQTRYRIDRIRDSGEVDEWFYGDMFPTRDMAQSFIDNRTCSYRGDLFVAEFITPAGYVYEGVIKLA